MKNSMEKLKKIPIQSTAIVLGLILMVTFFSIASSNFLTPSNINNILLATMINGILSVGALYVVVTGGIDVSIGTSMTFVSVMLGVFMNWWGMPAWMGIICGILTGAAVGLINGIMVTKMKITPFIATLGMQMVTAGLAIVITDGTPIYFTQIQGYQNIALGSPFAGWLADLGIADYAINTGVIIMFLLAILFLGIGKVIYLYAPYSDGMNVLFSWCLYTVAPMSVGMGLFNLIPFPPLDGSKVLAVFLPDGAYGKLMRYERYGILILLALSWLGLGGNALGNAIYSVYAALFHIFFA